MKDVRIFDVLSAVGKSIESNMQSIVAMNIIAAPREKSKRNISIPAAILGPGRCQVRTRLP